MNIEELASKFASRYTHRSAPLESVWTFTNRTLADFEKAIRQEVLEQAAQKCDDMPAPAACSGVEKSLWDVATLAAVDAIRAMKPV